MADLHHKQHERRLRDRLAAGVPANKGKFDGECNRRACRVTGARMWSAAGRAYYCPACAKEISHWSGIVGVAPMVLHASAGDVKP